jgi:hypothetical protein
MEKKKILEIALYCTDHECPMDITMKSGERKIGTALNLVRDEFLIIRLVDENDLIPIAAVDSVKCAWGRVK